MFNNKITRTSGKYYKIFISERKNIHKIVFRVKGQRLEAVSSKKFVYP